MWLDFIRIGLMLVIIYCIIIAIYKTYKTLRMSKDDTFLRLDNQLDAFKHAVIALAISVLWSLIGGL